MRVALWAARPRPGGVDAVLTDGRLLSCASTDESIASAWNLRPRRVRGKRARRLLGCSVGQAIWATICLPPAQRRLLGSLAISCSITYVRVYAG